MFFCLESEGSNGSLFSNGLFQCFPVYKIVFPIFSGLGTEGSKGSLFSKCVVTMFSCLGTEGSNGSLYTNGWFQCFPV